MPPTPFPKSLLQPKPCLWPFQATLGQFQEDPCMIQPKAPQILYTFCKTPNTQSTVRRERPRSSPKCGAGVPTFSVPLLSGASSSEQRSGLLPLLVGGGGTRPYSPSQALPWGLLVGLHPLFSAGTQRKGGRAPAARLNLGRMPRGWTRAGHGASWGDWLAGEIRRQQGWEQGKGRGSLGWHAHQSMALKSPGPKVRVQITAHQLPGCVALCQQAAL